MLKQFTSTLTFAILAIFSTALLAQNPNSPPKVASGQPPSSVYGRSKPFPTPEQRERYRQKLGITVQQQEQLDALYAEADKKRKELWDKMREMNTQHWEMLETFDYDKTKERIHRYEMSKLYRSILFHHTDTEDKIRKLLTKEQFERLVAMRKEMASKWKTSSPRKENFR